MSIEQTTVNRVTSELIDIVLNTPTRGRKSKVVPTDEGVSDDQGRRALLLVLPIIVSQEGVIHEYTNV